MAVEALSVVEGIPVGVPQPVPIVAIDGVSISVGDRFSHSRGVSLSLSLGEKMLEESIFTQHLCCSSQTTTFDMLLKVRKPCCSSKFCVGCSIACHSCHSWACTCKIHIKRPAFLQET